MVSSNLQSELIFRVRSYDFLHRNNRPLPLPLLDKPKPLNSQIPRGSGKFSRAMPQAAESNDRIESWRMETRARTMDARDWVTLPPGVLLLVVPTVPSHAIGLFVRSSLCCAARYAQI